MSIDLSGRDANLESTDIVISVSGLDPLIKLGNVLPWPEMMDRVAEDLKSTTAKGFWWVGRNIIVRIHLAIFLLQKLYDLTDRMVIEQLRGNAVFQLFCGYGIVKNWKIPAFTKVEEFRNRLSPETQRWIVNLLAREAVALKIADPSSLDVDSTVQEANMAYAADGNLMVKLARKVGKVAKWLAEKAGVVVPTSIGELMAPLGSLAKGYFFASKKDDVKMAALATLHAHVKKLLYTALETFESLPRKVRASMPQNITLHLDHVTEKGKRYMLDVAHYLRTGKMKPGKILSFHLSEVAYINKNKVGKQAQFGREYQIGRLTGNIVIASPSPTIRTNDKSAMVGMVGLHQDLFGKGALDSVSADRGYYSRANQSALAAVGETSLGYQWHDQGEADFRRLADRRAGIEPIIGHIKQGGQLDRSRMKSDQATYAAGYGAMVGFNLRQIMRAL